MTELSPPGGGFSRRTRPRQEVPAEVAALYQPIMEFQAAYEVLREEVRELFADEKDSSLKVFWQESFSDCFGNFIAQLSQNVQMLANPAMASRAGEIRGTMFEELEIFKRNPQAMLEIQALEQRLSGKERGAATAALAAFKTKLESIMEMDISLKPSNSIGLR
jgi:hypothetical protein